MNCTLSGYPDRQEVRAFGRIADCVRLECAPAVIVALWEACGSNARRCCTVRIWHL